MLDFEAIKRIPIVEEAVGHYRLPLRLRGDYANAICPLPTHKEGDRTKSFSINLAGNYWRCFSDSCNAGNGGKRGGDVINLVAAMEKCRKKTRRKSSPLGLAWAKKKPRLAWRHGLIRPNNIKRPIQSLALAAIASSTCRSSTPGSMR